MPQITHTHSFVPNAKKGGLICAVCNKGRSNVMHAGLPEGDPDEDQGSEEGQGEEVPAVTHAPAPRLTARRSAQRRHPAPPPPEPEDEPIGHAGDFGTQVTDDPDMLLALIDRGIGIADQLPDGDAKAAILERAGDLWLQLVQ